MKNSITPGLSPRRKANGASVRKMNTVETARMNEVTSPVMILRGTGWYVFGGIANADENSLLDMGDLHSKDSARLMLMVVAILLRQRYV